MSIESRYVKLSQVEHVLKRPDTYVGSIVADTEHGYVYDKEKQRIVWTELTYAQGLYKIFDEILVNAADNRQRDPSMDNLKVSMDLLNNSICVYNNGSSIPVCIHQEHHVYVPELIFGHLLNSSNYNDAEKRTTGGRGGYGAKLGNIFSKLFTVETVDSARGLKYVQTWLNNMSIVNPPKITKIKAKFDYTKITLCSRL